MYMYRHMHMHNNNMSQRVGVTVYHGFEALSGAQGMGNSVAYADALAR